MAEARERRGETGGGQATVHEMPVAKKKTPAKKTTAKKAAAKKTAPSRRRKAA